MKIRIIIALSASLLAFTAKADIRPHDSAHKEVSKEIEVTEWTLNHSSVARTITTDVLDKSMSGLQRARQELDNGNLRTAREWIRKASQPLVRMDDAAMTGKHPDPLAYKLEIRETLQSLLPVAERIAAEKSAPADFIVAARAALSRGDALLQSRQFDAARAVLENADLDVRHRLAELLRGDYFYLAVPRTARAEDWLDGLSRIEERRVISRYLMIEAESEGADILPLQSGLQIAEATVAQAELFAQDMQWARALDKLDSAYAQYEATWRAVGVDW